MVGEIIGAIAIGAHACCLTCVGPIFCGYEPGDVGYHPGYGFSATEYLLLRQKDD